MTSWVQSHDRAEDNVGTYNQVLLLLLLIMSVCALTATVVCALWRSAFLSTWQSCRRSWKETLKCDVRYRNQMPLSFFFIPLNVLLMIYSMHKSLCNSISCNPQHHNKRFILSLWVCSLYWMRCKKNIMHSEIMARNGFLLRCPHWLHAKTSFILNLALYTINTVGSLWQTACDVSHL